MNEQPAFSEKITDALRPWLLGADEADVDACAEVVLAAMQPELDRLADYENRITWHTTCASCARLLDSSIQETERRERAETTLREVLDAFEAYWARASYCGPGTTAVQPEHFRAWRATLNQRVAAHNDGPSVAEAAADDATHWTQKYAGE